MVIRNLGLEKKLMLLLSIFSLAFFAFAFVSWHTIETVRVNGPLYGSIVEGKDLVADILPPPAYIIESHLLSLQLAEESEAAQQALLIERGNALRVEFDRRHEHWKRALAPGTLSDTMNVSAYRPAVAYFEVREAELIPAVRARNPVRVQAAMTVLNQRYEEHRRAIDSVVRLTNERNLQLEQTAEKSVSDGRRNLIVLGGLVLAVVAVLAWLTLVMANSLTARLSLAAGVASRVADGDLTVRVPDASESDESGRLLTAIQAMTTSLHSLVARVRLASNMLSASTAEFTKAGRQQDRHIGGLRDSAVQIAGGARSISETSADLMSTMESVNAVAGQAAQVAEGGRSLLEGMQGAMQQLQQGTVSISTRLGTIREKTSDISGVVTTITKIADQTNLLSINAAIEAEKAGDQGLGFMVLAREIRRLADQTAAATLDIEQMVRHMQSAVSAGVMEMDGFAAQVERGVGVTAQVGTQLGQIIGQVKALSERFDAVNHGMRSQSQGARQISEAMTQLMAGAQAGADALPEFNASIAGLRDAADSLTQEISRFKLGT
ncbi:MAG: methyl-accepting chemotaxis protein [Burkholderiales bacterium]|nr:MAG: methyl-accepting chemotaxis protein [Burkholderiales bacterium]